MLNIDDRLIREVSPKIGPNALSVLLAISIHLNQKTNRCFPAHHTLMALTGLGKNTVYDALNVLKDNGLLVVQQSVNSDKKQFGKRTFLVNTTYIGVFVSAKDIEPLPNSREPESREPESREPESWETYQINNTVQINNIAQINNVSVDAPAQNEFSTLEEKEKKSSYPAPPPAGPGIRDFVNADTPGEMLKRIAAFYATDPGQREKEVIYSNTLAGKMTNEQRRDVVERFAAWAVRENYGQRTFRELNSQFYTWWKNQTRFQQPAAAAPAQQTHRADGPTMRSGAHQK
jgi:hypothetical protein